MKWLAKETISEIMLTKSKKNNVLLQMDTIGTIYILYTYIYIYVYIYIKHGHMNRPLYFYNLVSSACGDPPSLFFNVKSMHIKTKFVRKDNFMIFYR